MKIIVILLVGLMTASCANMKLSWDAISEKSSSKKSLDLPRKSNGNSLENEQLALDVLRFYSDLLSIPLKERKSQLSLAKARFEASPDMRRRLELAFAYLATHKSNKHKDVNKLVSEIDSKKLLENDQLEVYALLQLITRLPDSASGGDTSSNDVSELNALLAEKDVEISKLQEQIDALKNIEQSIHQRELGTISDGK